MNNNLKRDFYQYNRNKEVMIPILIFLIPFLFFAIITYQALNFNLPSSMFWIVKVPFFWLIISWMIFVIMILGGAFIPIVIFIIGGIWLVKVKEINRVLDENDQEVFEDYARRNKRKYEKYSLGKEPTSQDSRNENRRLKNIVIVLVICVGVLMVFQLGRDSRMKPDNAHIYFEEEKVHYVLTPQHYLEKQEYFWKRVNRVYLSTNGQKTRDDHQIIANRCLLGSVNISGYNLGDETEYSRNNVEGLIKLFNAKGYEDGAWKDGIKFSKKHSGTDEYTVNYSLIYDKDNPGECRIEIIDESSDEHVVFTLEINRVGEKQTYSETEKRVSYSYETKLVYRMETEEGRMSYVVMDSIDNKRNALIIGNVSFSSISNREESFEEFKRLAGILESELYELLGTDE